ncbi:hypothetical protein E4U52_003584 [Claviceps spartinae]|nr:hypothetical protein E4U52_003584 [Claviceps spartinae]
MSHVAKLRQSSPGPSPSPIVMSKSSDGLGELVSLVVFTLFPLATLSHRLARDHDCCSRFSTRSGCDERRFCTLLGSDFEGFSVFEFLYVFYGRINKLARPIWTSTSTSTRTRLPADYTRCLFLANYLERPSRKPRRTNSVLVGLQYE